MHLRFSTGTGLSLLTAASLICGSLSTNALVAAAGVSQKGAVAIYSAPRQQSLATGAIDFVNAQPMELPRVVGVPPQTPLDSMMQALATQSVPTGQPRYSPGAFGNGKRSPVFLGLPKSPTLMSEDGVAPQEHGTSGHPFSTARADAAQGSTHTQYPFRASGKLFFNIGADTYVCSASMIKKGIVLTAAHCVAQFGGSFYSNFLYVPGYRNGAAPYGVWGWSNVAVMSSYLNGTDSCAVAGIVCANDIAVIRLAPKSGAFAGTSTGFYGFGVNGYGFSSGLTQVTQIGYPVCLDNGGRMQRTDSQGYVDSANSNNTVIGSLMCGGSSGGPWLVNFGVRPSLTGTSSGTFPRPNAVIGVTSWGYISNAPKQLGASAFTSNNIGVLANALCGGTPNPC